MRILDKYLLKELLKTFLAVLTVLLLITFGSEATQLLAMAVEGKIPSSIVFQVLLLKIPPALEVILPLVALLSIMLAMGRLYQDQEMVVLTSCGVSPAYFQKIMIVFLLPIALLTGWISLVVTPWSYQTERLLVSEAQTATPVSGLVAGRFNPLPNNEGVFYTKSISPKGELSNVWVQRLSAEEDVILVAPKGRFQWQDDRLILLLESGYSYQGMHGYQREESSIVVQQFKRMELLIPELSVKPPRPAKYEVATATLWGSDDLQHQALLQWRLVTPFGILVLGLIGLKMSKTGPREGRFAKIFLALVLYIVYNQFLVMGRDGIANGTWSNWIGLWPIPLVFLVFALVDREALKNRLANVFFKRGGGRKLPNGELR
ncbi:Lipopolysaccharide export system permease protein LptF [hydrothermal vent metagenome]|uniref:Lipopolysaccharide export system permease protein LptF n=2 Tax=hydrothermal vent metagenome TaxID=652676 RepID=A0A3B0WFV5_9ZZZZ